MDGPVGVNLVDSMMSAICPVSGRSGQVPSAAHLSVAHSSDPSRTDALDHVSCLNCPIDDDGDVERRAHGPELMDNAVHRPVQIGVGGATELRPVAVPADVHHETLELEGIAALRLDDV